jgi:beta-glucosidase
MFALWDSVDGWIVEPGGLKLFVGGSSRAIALQGDVLLTGGEHLTGPGRVLTSSVEVEW